MKNSGKIQRPRTALLLVVFGVALGLMCGYAPAQVTHYWANASGGNFQTPTNWDTGVGPTNINDRAFFDITSAPYTVTWSANVSNDSFRVRQGTTTFDFGGKIYTLKFQVSEGASVSYLGDLGPADLTVTNGSMIWPSSVGGAWVLSSSGTVFRVCGATTVQLYRVYAGTAAGDYSSIIVDGPKAQFKTENFMRFARGNLLVTNGAYVLMGGGSAVGYGAGGNAIVTVSGTNSIFEEQFGLDVGSAGGTGTIYAVNGGMIKNSNENAGQPTYRTLTILTNGTVTLDNGSLQLIHTNAELYCRGGVLQGTGSNRCYFQNLTGRVRPGGTNNAGVLLFNGTYNNGDTNSASPPGTLEMELGGTQTSAFDRLVVSGSLVATGTVSVSLINGFQPASGDRFKILDFNTIIGTFNTVILPGDERHWNLRNLYITGEIQYLIPGAIVSVF